MKKLREFPQFFQSKPVCKPSYVLDNHLSDPAVASRLKRPTRSCRAGLALLFGLASGWGLQSPFCYQKGGELLPRLSTLTGKAGGLFLLHWPWSHLHRVLPGILALGSSDFPLLRPFGTCSSDYLADLRKYSSTGPQKSKYRIS